MPRLFQVHRHLWFLASSFPILDSKDFSQVPMALLAGCQNKVCTLAGSLEVGAQPPGGTD